MTNKILLGLALILSGCAGMQSRDIDIAKELTAKPVHQIYIFPPVFSKKYAVRMKSSLARDDYQEMKPENQSASSANILSVFSSLISSTNYSLALATDYVPDEKAVAWAKKISQSLVDKTYSESNININKQRFDPKEITPMDLPVESVLLIGVIAYGYEDTQLIWQTILDNFNPNFKPRRVGKPSWDQNCRLVALLIDPKTGKLLMSVDWGESKGSDQKDPQLLESVTKECVQAILDGASLKKRALLQLGY